MKMVVGGAFQGKTDFAVRTFHLRKEDILDGGRMDFGQLEKAAAVRNFHELIRRMMESGEDPAALVDGMMDRNRGIVIIMDEVGCGLVPIDPGERAWREMCGRLGCRMADASDEVYLVTMGLGQKIKG